LFLVICAATGSDSGTCSATAGRSDDDARSGLRDAEGREISGFSTADCPPLGADSVRLPVVWSGGADLAALNGQQITIEFRLTGAATLYAFTFAE
jgi:hypothetical protein